MRILFLLLISFASVAQVTFEKGYVIDNEGNKIDCLIKNVDWLYNPTGFSYKSGNDSLKKGGLSSVKEFGVYGYSKFVRSNVKIDRSKLHAQELTTERNPVWSQEILFLKVLVEGTATLYLYEDNNLMRFFYSVNDSSIEQLVYKKYIFSKKSDYAGDQIGENNLFQQQLFNNMKCQAFTADRLKRIHYKKNDLENFFNEYNRCLGNGSPSEVKKEKAARNVFNIKILTGLALPSLTISPPQHSSTIKFNTPGLFLGTEFEFIFPFNKNKWSFLVAPTYQTLQSSTKHGEINFSSVEFPLGLRHYLFLSRNSKLFLNCLYVGAWRYSIHNEVQAQSDVVWDFLKNNWLSYQGEVRLGRSYAFGLGVEIYRLSVEARYYTPTNALNLVYWGNDYRKLSFIIAYKFYKLQR